VRKVLFGYFDLEVGGSGIAQVSFYRQPRYFLVIRERGMNNAKEV
jgi:hypothetical protein